MSDETDSFFAGERCSAMWKELGEMIASGIQGIVNDGNPREAILWATCAEACFWKATGEADAHDVKDVLAQTSAYREDEK